MGMLSGLMGRKRRERVDARGIYNKLMAQSRIPAFFGEAKMPDTYEGRIELLTFHMSFIMTALRAHGEQGSKLSQALYDEMVDDFDISLREESLTDSGVRRRIKPIVRLFYARLKAFTENAGPEPLQSALKEGELGEASEEFVTKLAAYGTAFSETLSERSLGDLARSDFVFPAFEI